MRRQPQSDEVESDLRAGEMGLALLAAATFYFGGWLGLFPALWFLWAITDARVTPEQRRRLAAPATTTWRYVRTGELPEGTPRIVQRALGGHVPGRELPAPATEGEAGAPARGPRPAWLQAINDEPDQRPHTIILGPTRSGKTTMATAAMADRGGRAVVLTPKLNPSNWRGAEIVTLDDEGSYAPITAALGEIEQEKRRRIKVLRSEGADALEPLTIVFDELGELAAFEPRAPEAMVSLSSIGAELKMRLIGIGTSDEALGIKRWKATRNNYVRVETNTDRAATINDGVRTVKVQPRESLAIARDAQLRPWRGEDPTPPAPAPATGTTTSLRRAAVAADAPRGEVVSVRLPERQAARATAPDDLLASLMAELPAEVRAQVPDLSPERADRLVKILGEQGMTAQSVIKVASAGGDTFVINANKAEATATPPPAAPARQRKLLTPSELAARREWASYYKRAARAKPPIPFDRAYQAAPVKGNRNHAHAIYKAARTDTAS